MQSRNAANLQGINLSHYDAGITLADIPAKGKKIVYLKATEGTSYKDNTFADFNTSLRKLGIRTGAYHFAHFYKVSTVDVQVANFLAAIKGQVLDCALAVDCEADSLHDGVGKDVVTAQTLDFANKIRTATGAKVIFYANTAFIQEHMTADIARLEAWIADYRYANAPGENGILSTWTGFQYSSGGAVGGKTVDLDEFTASAVLAGPFCYGSYPPTPVPPPAPSGDPAVRAYQHKLNAIRIRDDAGQPLDEDGLNGPKTKQAVIRLEKLMELTVDSGIWGSQCEGAYTRLTGAKPQLKQGSTGPFVRYLQYRLGGLTVDGVFGAKTLAAVKAFQKARGLAVDGIVGVNTWAALMK